ncbi:MAG: zinc-ribbon domain-containing protein [Clostridia bacterium]|nr:zinc-ribbon domain-containing protein [Clostridia bacterium]
MKYYVYVNGRKDFFDLTGEPYEPGTEVQIRIPFLTDVSTYVRSEEVCLKNLGCENGSYRYSFIMPECDVNIDVTHKSLMTMMDTMGAAFPMGMMGSFPPLQPEIPQNDSKPSDLKRIFCSECGAPNVSTSKFCRECGSKLKKEEQE